jgi:hypothetical protein
LDRSESVLPWRGYLLWVGTALLVMICVTHVLIPAAPNPYLGASLAMPKIKIHSDVKPSGWDVIDTSRFVTPERAGSAETQVASDDTVREVLARAPEQSSALPSKAGADARDSFAQLAVAGEAAQASQPKSAHRKRRSATRSDVAHPIP